MIRKHRNKKKHHHKKGGGLELLFNSRVLMIIGIAFLLTGAYYWFSSSTETTGLNMLMNFLKSSDDVQATDTPEKGMGIVFLGFVPAFLVLILSLFYSGKFSSFTYPVSVIGALYLLLAQVKISVFNFNAGSYYYPSFTAASLFLFIPVLLLIAGALLHRRPILLILACVYFYLSVVLYAANYSGRFEYLFPFAMVFSGMIAYAGKKIEKPYVSFINFSLSVCFFGLFWFRKFVVNFKSDFLPQFFIFGVLFYLLFYAIEVYVSNTEERTFKPWMQMVFTWSNLIFFAGTTAFVLLRYYVFSYLWVFACLLLLINVTGLYIIRKQAVQVLTIPHHFSVLFLAALILPLVIHQNMALIFTGVLSVVMLFYADAFKNRAAMLLSLAALAAMILVFATAFVSSYTPSIVTLQLVPRSDLLLHGAIGGFVMVSVFSASLLLLVKVEIPMSKEWFSKKQYSRLIQGFQLFSVFFTLGWILFSLLALWTGSMVHSTLGWFISGALFFVSLIYYYSGKQSYYKKPVLYFASVFVLLYPLMVQWSMTGFRKELIDTGELNITAFVLHYAALILLVVLGRMVFQRISRRNKGKAYVLRGAKVVGVLFILFLLCAEYNNFSVIVKHLQSVPGKGSRIGEEILIFNRHLPFSVLIWIAAVFLLIRAVYQQDRFLKGFSFVLLAGILIKVFVYDFEILGPGEKGMVFFTVGLFLAGMSFFYPRLVKAGK